MTPDDPRHGTPWGYTVHTRERIPACQPCKDAKSAADRRRRKLNTQGKYGRQVLGDRVYKRVKDAKDRHISNADIAAAAGISEATVERIVRLGPNITVATNVKARLAVMPPVSAEITGIGYSRRLRALACLGYSSADFAREAGIDMETVKKARRTPPRVVKREVRQTILETYDRLCLTPRASTDRRERAVITLTVNIARRAGWPPPLAWDDIDDPNEQPTDWAYTAPDRGTALRDLADMGAGITETCRRLRVGRESLQKWCRNNGMSDVYRKLASREALDTNQYTGRGAA